MPLAAEDLERRRPLWAAMSDLFLDTETRWHTPRIALACARSGYADPILEQVFWAEVFPLAIHNLHDLAGEWALLELPEADLLARADLAQRDAALERRSAWMVASQWRAALALSQHLRSATERQWQPLVQLHELIARRYFEDVGRNLAVQTSAQLCAAREAGLDLAKNWQFARPHLEAMATAEERASLPARAEAVELLLG